jgi:tRNA G18 (ribose-2'-O)-methylase SpoU
VIEVDDPTDPRVRLYCGLPDAVLRRQVEDRHGVFVVEGALAVRQLLRSAWPVHSLLLRPERVGPMRDLLDSADQAGVPVYVAGRDVFDRIAGFPAHRGVLALGQRRPEAKAAECLRGVRLAVVVEGVNDHENLGAIFRNAAALGAGAVLLDPTCCDPLCRRSVRVSLGHVLRVPFCRLTDWPDGLRRLRDAGLFVLALDPGSPTALETVAAPAPVAVLVGAEGAGLSTGALAAATARARIEMAGEVDSLNVATALAIALHHLRLACGKSATSGANR